MKLATALRLGRVSNLPTVCTNALAGMTLAGGMLAAPGLLALMLASALAYTAGMFLNDAFDAEIDAREQRFRPIPSGLASRGEVFAWGYALLAASVLLFAAVGLSNQQGLWSAAAGLVLAGLIVAYNRHHKENAFGPLLMGLCRVLVYVAAGLTLAASLPLALWVGAGVLLCHVMGLTFLAKMEGAANALGRVWPLVCLLLPVAAGAVFAYWQPLVLPFVLALAAVDALAIYWCRRNGPGDVGRSIPLLIAGICLVDAMLAASQGHAGLAAAMVLFMPATLFLQRWVRGT